MPIIMSSAIQCVQVQGTVYVGGGDAGYGSVNQYRVMTYNIRAGKWATLPLYSTRYFAMTAIDNHLVLVGGAGRDIVKSKVLGVWSEDSKKWIHPYPDMTTPRHSCSVVVYTQWLVVAGGNGDSTLSSIEVMNIDIKQWYAGPLTPIAWAEMKTAIVGDTCYFMGGFIEGTFEYTTKVYSVSLPALISQLNPDSSAKDTQTWKELPQLPVNRAAPLSIRGSLLAVGGRDKDNKAVSALHLYQPDAGQWVKVADMPTQRYDCTCTMTTDQELLVVGGHHVDWPRSANMDIAQIL